MDLSLDEIVSMKRRGRGRGVGRGALRSRGQGRRGGLVGTPIQADGRVGRGGGVTATKTGKDLRDVLATKQKMQVVDLRAKIKPKVSPVSVGRGRGRPHLSQRGGRTSAVAALSFTAAPRRARSRSPIRKSFSSPPPPAGPNYPNSKRRRESPIRLPSSAETKKITVTVPGLNRPVSEQNMYRREEQLATAIQRSKEPRHENFLRGREEVLAQAITSAIGGGGGGGGGMERDPVGTNYQPRMQMRYNRSPSSGMDPSLGGGYGAGNHAAPAAALSRSKGITTMTTMTISNLSDTVSKNDIAELCGAVGSLETVAMVAPGVAEVVFKYKDDALEAFKKYNQRNLDGQPMICKLQATSRGRAMHTGGSGGGYGGMRGGYMDSYGGGDFSYNSNNFY